MHKIFQIKILEKVQNSEEMRIYKNIKTKFKILSKKKISKKVSYEKALK